MSMMGRIVLYLCFFVSGTVGLAYEVIWTRLLSLSFGHTVYAVTTVLTAFMGGLALGSWQIGKLADRTKQPLRLYALLELAIGLSCLAVPHALEFARSTYLALYPHILTSTPLKTFVQFALSFIVLLIPTTLMGGTLPAVLRGVVEASGRTGERVALLYGTNTVGAALGALAAGYWLLPAIGIKATNLLGAIGNLAVAAVVLAAFRKNTVTPDENAVAVAPALGRTHLEKILVLGFFLSGAISMFYQIAWVRSLVLIIASSTYAFSAILVTFLLGLSLGGFLFKFIPRMEQPWFFALLQLGIGVTGFLLVPFFNYLPQAFLTLFTGYQESFAYILVIQFLVVLPFVLAPTILMGMTFPCLAGILANRMERMGQDVGRIYAYNTLGAIAGSIIAGFALIPLLGAQNTIKLGVAVNLSIGALILSLTVPRARALIAVATPVAAALLLLSPSWDRQLMISGIATHPLTYLREDGTLDRTALNEDLEILYFKEDISSTVAVARQSFGNTVLRINGKPAASYFDVETNFKLAYIPIMHHPGPRSVAVVGLGSGVTGGVATLFDSVEKIDIVELNPAVRGAPEYFRPLNFGVLDDPRVAVHIDDGRSFLSSAREKYDVIISEPSNLWIAGVANLFTREFMSSVKSRLAPGGVYGQWLQGYTLSPESFKTVVRTFKDVFPEATLWEMQKTDYLLIGRKEEGNPVDIGALRTRILANPRLVDTFHSTFRDDPLLTIFRSFRLDAEELSAFAGADAPLNRDDRNILEFEAPKSLYRQQYARIASEINGLRSRSFPSVFVNPQLGESERHLLFGKYLMSRGLFTEAARALGRFPSLAPPTSPGSGVLSLEGRRIVQEDFDGEGTIPLLPQLGIYRPEGGEALESWTAHLDCFTRLSGLAKNEGLGGGTALALDGLEGVTHASYFTPLAVKPGALYQVAVSLRSEMGAGGEAGVGMIEYDSLNTAEEMPSSSFIKEHKVRAEDKVRIRGLQGGWSRHTFRFRASPVSRMSHIVFYREGAMDAGRALFDNLTIEALAEE